ncbi:MAG: HDOD domain-containing protein [Planctomycetales bacterium]
MAATTAIDWQTVREQALGEFTIAALPPTLQLPALPHAVTTYLQKSEDPQASLKDLARIIETDTGLTVELLKQVNSTAVGLRHRATTVQQALTLLGQKRARTFVVTTGMQAAVRSRKSRLINQSCFWNASLQKALFAKEVAQLLQVEDLEIAFAGALLQDYLLPVITNDLFDSYLVFIERRSAQPKVITDFERKTFGWDHALAGACLAHRWKLPDELVCCVLHHHRGLKLLADPLLGRSAAAAVAVSALIPDQLRQHYQGLEHLLLLQEKWPAFDLEAVANRVDEQQAALGLGVRNDFPLARRCRPAIESVPQAARA